MTSPITIKSKSIVTQSMVTTARVYIELETTLTDDGGTEAHLTFLAPSCSRVFFSLTPEDAQRLVEMLQNHLPPLVSIKEEE